MFVLIIIAAVVGLIMMLSYRGKEKNDKSSIVATFAIVCLIVSLGYLMVVSKVFSSSYVDKKSNRAKVFKIVSLDNPNSEAFTIKSSGEKNTEEHKYSFFVQNRDKTKTETIIPGKDTKVIESYDTPEYKIINCSSGYEISYIRGWYIKTDPCETETSRVLKVPVGTIILGE